jgi:hypothetical protein
LPGRLVAKAAQAGEGRVIFMDRGEIIEQVSSNELLFIPSQNIDENFVSDYSLIFRLGPLIVMKPF